jgi:hypothetical protein
MPKRRDDILQRTRQIMAQYTDRQIIVDFFNDDDDDQRLSVSDLLVQIREQLRGEFGCSIDTARHHIALVVDERRKKYIVQGPDGYALDWNNKE